MIPFTVTPGLDHLLPAYLDELAQDAENLRQIAPGPLAEIAVLAHALGGKCAMIGDHPLAEMLYQIEGLARAESRAAVDAVLARFFALSADRRP